jgi:DNA helicase-2/ATP-dependent DNA helicase PcrA
MSLFEERYRALNDEQRAVVDTLEGPVLVVAGPGSGKTEVLGLRVANILRSTDTHPSALLCLTYTDSAALAMRQRLAGLIGRDAYRVQIATFHSFSVEVMNRYPAYFYDGASFLPADDFTQAALLQEILDDLDHDHPLKKIHPDQGYTYAKAIQFAIQHLKRAGITPEDFRVFLEQNTEALQVMQKDLSLFDETVSKKIFPQYQAFAERLLALPLPAPLPEFPSLARAIGVSLKAAVAQALAEEKATPISEWKKDHLRKDDAGKRVFRDSLSEEKLKGLASIYARYRERMHERGFYDFDDMLLDVLQALRTNPSLRHDLAERFHYILVDEFQDTNDAQMQLIAFLAPSETASIMAVGDDDQAIYKFQGAEISNILAFHGRYAKPRMITLTKNYRSRQQILDLARHIIQKGSDRLENRLEGLRKDLVALGQGLAEGHIMSRSFASRAHEYHWIASEIRRLLDQGIRASSIAVIARQHKDLESLLPYLSAVQIPVSYDRQRNVLHEPHIRQLIQMARYIALLAGLRPRDGDAYLPEILSYPFWGVDRKTMWDLSSVAGARHIPWIDAMLAHGDPRVRGIGSFFLELRDRAQYEPAEVIFDALIGSHGTLIPESADEDDILPFRAPSGFLSPFRSYYFSAERYADEKPLYLAFLSALRTFVRALREHHQGSFVTIQDAVSFIDTHTAHGMPITDQSPFVSADDAVSLLTAHKAKGLEFAAVFVVSCQDAIWARGSHGTLLPFPLNLPIAPAGDTLEDQLRLFYVALTRAKQWLYLTSYATEESGKGADRLRFLLAREDEVLPETVRDALLVTHENSDIDTTLTTLTIPSVSVRPPYVADEQALLRTLIQNYQMSVTHLNNFLNVRDGGPTRFLEQNLLRFPQAKSVSATFGSLMHGTIEAFYGAFRSTGVLPSREQLCAFFTERLERERLSPTDSKECMTRGGKALTAYYDAKASSFSLDDQIEVDFKDQGVLIGDAMLSGKIDKLVRTGVGLYRVVDFKTGKGVLSFDDLTDPYEQVKMHQYRRQLLFYKLLVEHSRDFGGSVVREGALEFLEPVKGSVIEVPLQIEDREVERVRALISKVHEKIMHLDFPDTSRYSPDLKGILAFEEDLLQA